MLRPFPFQLTSPADSNQGRYGSRSAPLLSKSSWSIRCKPFTSLHLSASSVPKTFIIVWMNGIHIGKGRISRRELLKKIAGAGACVPFAYLSALSEPSALQKQTAEAAVPPAETPFSSADDAFLEELEKANFQYFWGQAHPETGLGQHRGHRLRADRSLHWRKTWVCVACGGSVACSEYVALFMEKIAQPSGILLPLGQYKYRRKNMGFRSFVRRHRHPALRSYDL